MTRRTNPRFPDRAGHHVRLALAVAVSLLGMTAGCTKDRSPGPRTEAPASMALKNRTDLSPTAMKPSTAPKAEVQMKADAFLKSYLADLSRLEKVQTAAYWKAANSGKKEDFKAFAKAELALKKLHSDAKRYQNVLSLLKQRQGLKPLTRRALEVALLAFQGNQLPKPLLAKMVNAATEIERIFNTYRGKIGGREYSNNQLLARLRKERSTAGRKAVWEALKQVGAQLGPKLVALAKVRNEAATKLGFKNYWEMQIKLQEHEPNQILAIFAELERLTDKPFRAMKTRMDAELGRKFKLKPAALMPWHYDNPFFQAAPPSEKIDLDEFYKAKKKEDIVALAKKFYADIGIPIDDIVARSDLFERKGKDQHAFCIAMDRAGDVRMLTNIKATAEWMDTMLHETGHAVYYKLLDFKLPFNLREAAHTFTTEAIAMLFGALAKNPTWLTSYAGANAKRVASFEPDILEQRRREQLIFARWTLVMLHFEKALYENPDQDLNKRWWDLVERLQFLKRPPGRNEPDWAAKPHFTIAPVYYHNYMLGELFAAQLRATFAKMAGHTGPTARLSFNGRKDFGDFLTKKIFRKGMRLKWPQFVKQATGEPLNPQHFAKEVK